MQAGARAGAQAGSEEEKRRAAPSNMNQERFRKGSTTFCLVGGNSKAFAAFQVQISRRRYEIMLIKKDNEHVLSW